MPASSPLSFLATEAMAIASMSPGASRIQAWQYLSASSGRPVSSRRRARLLNGTVQSGRIASAVL